LSDIITAIEAGTTKMTVLICQKGRRNNMELLGLGQTAYGDETGKGRPSDAVLFKALESALEQAQKMAEVKISNCVLGLPNEFCGLVRNKKEIVPGGPVSKQDIIELQKEVSTYSLPDPWKVLKAIHGSFLADGQPMGNPLGTDCEKLGLEASLICIDTDFAQNLTRMLRSLNIGVRKWIPVPLAIAEAFLTEDEKEEGVLWVDTGGKSTDIAVFHKGMPIYFDWLPLGGNTITRDVVSGLNISFEEAERLKRYCVLGLAIADDPESAEMKVPVRDGNQVMNVPMDFLQGIVEARVEEIWELIAKRLEEEKLMGICKKALLTGGGLGMFRGIRELGSRKLNIPVQLGVPDVIGLSAPTYSEVYAVGMEGLKTRLAGKITFSEVIKALFEKFNIYFKST
jgi:cell division protein FtsA